MLGLNSQINENLPLIATIDNVALNAEKFSDVVDMSKYHKVMAVFAWGVIAGDMTCRAVTCDSGGTNVAALKTATKTTSNPDNSQIIIEVSNEDLAGGAANADQYIKFGIVSDNGADVGNCLVFGLPKNVPGTQLTSVIEVEVDVD
jgi:hypothetical protein